MGAQVVDYRVSTLVVLCKDCGNDVGLYPARHKCTPVDRPPMPPLQYNAGNTSSPLSSSTTTTESSSPAVTRWASRRGKQPMAESNGLSSSSTGKKLWGKVRQNDKWKQLNEKNDKSKQTGKLWGKLIQATQTMADKIPSRDERGAESDEDDWEGETHVSRILREYYEKNRLPLPDWLFDDRAPRQRITKAPEAPEAEPSAGPARTPSRRRLWEDTGRELSSRERERQELRQQQPPPLPESGGTPDSYRTLSLRDKHYDRRQYESKDDDYYRRDYHREDRRGYDDHYRDDNRYNRDNGNMSPQRHYDHAYQRPQSPPRQPRYYEDDHRPERPIRNYDRVDNRYNHPTEDYYYSSSSSSLNKHPTSLREQGRIAADAGRGGYRRESDRHNNYF
ncbi:unnamed protein product [Rhizopus microsporus]